MLVEYCPTTPGFIRVGDVGFLDEGLAMGYQDAQDYCEATYNASLPIIKTTEELNFLVATSKIYKLFSF